MLGPGQVVCAHGEEQMNKYRARQMLMLCFNGLLPHIKTSNNSLQYRHVK